MKILETVIVPTFNESKTLINILKQVNATFKNNNRFYEVIVVDDCSTDETSNLLNQNRNLFAKLITNKKNIGKGGAIKVALEHANGDYIFFQDADNEYSPQDFVKFFYVIDLFQPDLIVGSRFKFTEYIRSHYFMNKIGNLCLTFFFNFLNNTTFTDIYSCYVVFKKNYINPNELKTLGFEQQAEILGKIVRKGKKFYEVPVNYNGRTFEEGKKIKFIDFFKVIYQIIKVRFF
jgi:glycosyltransferase involved in cell wall biosynthesis